jgi:hypothetical protein
MKPVRIKIYSSFVLLSVAIIAFLWRILSPDDFAVVGKESIIYFMLLFSMAIIVSIIGFYGGGLTFPTEKK